VAGLGGALAAAGGDLTTGLRRALVERAVAALRDRQDGADRGLQVGTGGGGEALHERPPGQRATGERIARRHIDGSVVHHVYYRCANNAPPPKHPRLRWKAAKLEDAIVAELESMRIRDEGHAQLIRNTLTAAFADVVKLEADRRRILAKLRSEIRGRLDRLMNISLDGAIQQGEFAVKQGELRVELADVDRQLEEKPNYDQKRGETGLKLFDFMQNTADSWRRSNAHSWGLPKNRGTKKRFFDLRFFHLT